MIQILRIKCLFSIALLGISLAGTAIAFHGDALECNRCHTMHYSEDGKALQSGEGPFVHLLTKERSTELCLSCHDGQVGAPDVIGEEDANHLTERAAGFFTQMNTENANGHNIQTGEINSNDLCSTCHSGGNFSTATMGCLDCHDPHGKSPDSDPDYSYRNLRWANSSDDNPILRAFIKPGVAGLDVYEQENIGYAAPDTEESDWREVTNICLRCHHNFADDGFTRNSEGVCFRHPSTDSERGIWEPIGGNGSPKTDTEHWKTGTGPSFTIGRVPFVVSGAVDYAEARSGSVPNEVFCLTCHKAHGSKYENALRWSPSSSKGCQQCHNKG